MPFCQTFPYNIIIKVGCSHDRSTLFEFNNRGNRFCKLQSDDDRGKEETIEMESLLKVAVREQQLRDNKQRELGRCIAYIS